MVRKFIAHVLPGIMKPMRVLWNEIIAFVFACLAIIPVPKAFRLWREFDQTGSGLFNLGLSAFFIVMMGSFAVFSFLRARKISRS